MSGVIDDQGFRLNVGIVLVNDKGQVLLARRHDKHRWQFPQGGVDPDEQEQEALYRELQEEIGLHDHHVELVHTSENWHSYYLPSKFIRPKVPDARQCIGQKQRWFLLRMICDESNICLDSHDIPEFSEWQWFSPQECVPLAIYFKRLTYRKVLEEFTPYL